MADTDTSIVGTRIEIDGPAVLYYCAQSCGDVTWPVSSALNMLGITESGVSVSFSTNMHRVTSDDLGGGEGAPAELLFMGAQASVRGTLVKWGTGFSSICSGLNASAEGMIPRPGTPYFGNKYGFGIVIKGYRISYFFPRCDLASQPREWNISSLERKMSLNINAYPVVVSETVGSKTYQYFRTFWTDTADVETIIPDCGMSVN